jgi:hypothetical protein
MLIPRRSWSAVLFVDFAKSLEEKNNQDGSERPPKMPSISQRHLGLIATGSITRRNTHANGNIIKLQMTRAAFLTG